VAASDTLSRVDEVAPIGGREAIAGLLMRDRWEDYTDVKYFRCDILQTVLIELQVLDLVVDQREHGKN